MSHNYSKYLHDGGQVGYVSHFNGDNISSHLDFVGTQIEKLEVLQGGESRDGDGLHEVVRELQLHQTGDTCSEKLLGIFQGLGFCLT